MRVVDRARPVHAAEIGGPTWSRYTFRDGPWHRVGPMAPGPFATARQVLALKWDGIPSRKTGLT